MTSLAEYTTLRVGGTPSSLTVATTEQQIIDVVARADADGRSLLIIGSASNLVVADDFSGDVLVIANKGIENDASACAGAWVTVQAGENFDDFVELAVSSGWTGVETLSGIPGTVGATPIQNVGAYGQQVSDTIAQVRAYDRISQKIETLFALNCDFGYRTSKFKTEPNRWVILSVVFQLPLGTLSQPITYGELATNLNIEHGARVALHDVRAAVLSVRASKGMILSECDHDTWSTGSFFTNPIVDVAPVGAPTWATADGRTKVSAAWLIENAGLSKGFGLNDRVTISNKHSLAITNRGSGTATDVLELAAHIQETVRTKFGISLDVEPQIVH